MVCAEEKGKLYIFIKVLITIISPFVTLIGIIVPGLLIDELTSSVRSDVIITYIALLIVVPFIWNFTQQVINYYILEVMWNKLRHQFEYKYHEHFSRIDFDYFDKPDLMNLQSQAREVMMNDILGSVDSLCSIISTIISLFTLSTLITQLNVTVIIVIVINLIINFFVSKYTKKKLLSYENESRNFRRRKWVITSLLEFPSCAKEVRLFQRSKFFAGKLVEAIKDSDDFEHKKNIHSVRSGLIGTSTSMLQNLLVYSYTVFSVITGTISIGYMSIFNSAASQLSSLLGSIPWIYLSLYENSIKTQKYIDFMSVPSEYSGSGKLEPVFDKDSVIEFKNVSFNYFGNDRLVINNLNLKINSNEHLAIVGKNGSGKTTFVKLLTRLYKPTSGEILLNGININEYDYEKYQAIFSPVFQDYGLYDFSIRENIALSPEADDEELKKVSIMSGLESLLNKLTKGFNTQLGKNFDSEGVNLSGGEGQRLAIARARYYDRKAYLLDEPTAALDPYAENEIYAQFSNMILDKCAILITHRLSAVQLADKVAVFDEGHVAEYGTHKELYEKGGIYTDMFDKQAKFYRDKPLQDESV